MEKRNRFTIQKETVTDNSSPSTSNRRHRWDEVEADPILVIEQPEPEPFDWSGFTSKKDKKKRESQQTSSLPGWTNHRH